MKRVHLLVISLLIVLTGIATAAGYVFHVVSTPIMAHAVAFNSLVYDAKGSPLTELHGEVNRVHVSLDNVPEHVQDAFIAVEDERFYRHRGVDIRAIVRALRDNMTSDGIVQGGSTITQQVIKNYFLSPEKTLSRKIKEAILALRFEVNHSKEEILELYLNKIYLGEGAYGLKTAARVYFDKEVEDLSLSEGAVLAAITQAPSFYNPYKNLDAVKDRRDIVLRKMMEQGLIDRYSVQEALREPIQLKQQDGSQLKSKYPYYIDNVIEEAIKEIGEEMIFSRGVRIYTALEPSLQDTVDSVFEREKFRDDKIQSALALINSENGEIKALVGGRQYEANLGFNRATHLKRQPGSAFKPIAVYGPAFELGYTPDSIIEDSPRKWGNYQPQNSNGRYYGKLSIRSAVQWSSNLAAVILLEKIGVNRGVEFANRLGIELAGEDRYLSIALGGLTHGVSPLTMAGAFAVFANGGYYVRPHAITRIEDADGKVIYRAPQPKRVISSQTSDRMTDVLKSVVRSGTGRRAGVKGYEAAGKTGTTELPDTQQFRGLKGNKDAWFVGYVGDYTCAVWVGYDERDMDRNHYLRSYGGDEPAAVFGKVMHGVLRPGEKIPEAPVFTPPREDPPPRAVDIPQPGLVIPEHGEQDSSGTEAPREDPPPQESRQEIPTHAGDNDNLNNGGQPEQVEDAGVDENVLDEDD